ncbi:MAG TPA: penicillin-binding transpeptidase domain-containing protein [Candidatus Pacearchaeota archaeon]|nr:penicillin-binding transpeptidase domain-containing protein [Candidatus Pacearchaeota archaeon]HPZ74748.1 penicillin-binding transpeptidase domain-containing protein [Candidatus Pacearchaeota archaeon]HQD89243.1 penicillin-binding transpeptidase domain-containing protein [Candidatus Pacearchaeota archaeon]
MNSQNSHLYVLMFLFFSLGATIIGRLFYIQVNQYNHYKELADLQQIDEEDLKAERGEIFFSDESTVLATNIGTKKVFIVPREIKNIEKTSEILADVLKMEKADVLEKASQIDDPWIFLKEIPAIEGEKIKNIAGVHFESYLERFYPRERMASHVLGFYNKENKGQYGIEQYWQEELRGVDGYRKGVKDAKGKFILPLTKIQEPVDGNDLILTLDPNIQLFLEIKTKEIFEKYAPRNATIIVLAPKTGEVLGMASLPNFDPNNYEEKENISVFKNPAILAYEPGSIFKPFTAAMAIEEKKVTPQTTYYDSGEIKIGSHTIRNSDLKSHGTQTMTNVIELSLNTGAVFMQQQVGNDKFLDYVKKFGFGTKTGIDLSGEETGSIANILHPQSGDGAIEYANASFGQGISATPIQILTAFTAIANQGQMVKPHLVKKIIHSSDGTEEEIETEVIGQVISAETASRVTAMMVSAVKNGYGKKAEVEGYLIAGKTGTAQASWSYLGENKGGYSSFFIQSFVDFAPAFDPAFIFILKMDAPTKGPQFSSDSLGPFAQEINEYLFNYLGIPPEE